MSQNEIAVEVPINKQEYKKLLACCAVGVNPKGIVKTKIVRRKNIW